ncbi:hypothetical protein [Marinobacterium arenosum]|uniref:hypothetical protein n=1 Tax=Marinobacterium arenosum TaxID=2862496 RepID=UPI001C96DF5B|nr:hypothetical protein [Marinobacterium arenosum]MBY4677571.1 hypothetical protein [Marinobacterium arenosum]
MEFITKGESINCIRVIKDKDPSKETRITVASFNARVDRVPPHVAAELYTEEIKELVLWLEDRVHLQSRLERQPIENTILESFPLLVQQATQSLKSMDQLDSKLLYEINERLKELCEELTKKKGFTAAIEAGSKQMKNSEIQKERLDKIKKNIEDK